MVEPIHPKAMLVILTTYEERDVDIFVHDRATRKTTRVSVGPNGAQANGFNHAPSLSRDGRFVAFSSSADNLVPDDSNGTSDIFVHDRKTKKTTRVSVGPNGRQASGAGSFTSVISADGRFVAFWTHAANLVPSDTNRQPDVFVHDRKTKKTTRVSVGPNGRQANSSSFDMVISADGRFVAFASGATNLVSGDTNGFEDVFVHDRATRKTTRVSIGPDGTQADGHSGHPSISADGRFVAFHSSGALVPDDTNGVTDVYVRQHCRTLSSTIYGTTLILPCVRPLMEQRNLSVSEYRGAV